MNMLKLEVESERIVKQMRIRFGTNFRPIIFYLFQIKMDKISREKYLV
jgi:hypothetical protein